MRTNGPSFGGDTNVTVETKSGKGIRLEGASLMSPGYVWVGSEQVTADEARKMAQALLQNATAAERRVRDRKTEAIEHAHRYASGASGFEALLRQFGFEITEVAKR
jgi:hypothetical protein